MLDFLTVIGNVATPEVALEIGDVASKLPGWAGIPVTAGITLVVAGILYVLFKYVRGSAGQVGLVLAPELIEIAQKFLKNKPGLDVHDILNMVKHLAKSTSGAMSDIENKEFEDVKDELIQYVKESSAELGFNVPDSVIEKEAQAAFLLIKKFPQLMEQLKKSQ